MDDGDSDVRPAKRDANRREVENDPPRPERLDDRHHRPGRQARGRLVHPAVVEELVDRQAQAIEPLGQGEIGGDLDLDTFTIGAFETSEGVIKQVLGVHRSTISIAIRGAGHFLELGQRGVQP